MSQTTPKLVTILLAGCRDPRAWALGVLGMAGVTTDPAEADRGVVQRRFRDLVRRAHPDHGGDTAAAAQRISELSEARRILLAQ